MIRPDQINQVIPINCDMARQGPWRDPRGQVKMRGVIFLEQEEPFQHLAKLNGKFDAVCETVEFSVLTDGMQVLFSKGYRLTPSDQDALNKVTREQQS